METYHFVLFVTTNYAVWKIKILYSRHSKVLTQELKELEFLGLIDRKVFKELPPRVEYTLTKTGESLKPVLKVLCDWGKSRGIELEKSKSKVI